MPMVEDFSVFFNLAEFASVATISGIEVSGIFDRDYLLQDDVGGVSSSGPVLCLADSDVPEPVIGLPVVIDGVTYKVVEPKPDGTGLTVLRLRT